MVCMATNGAMAIEGGNWRIFENMLKESSANLYLNTTVTAISRLNDKSYQIMTDQSHNFNFDEIILAAPFQYTNITIDPAPQHVPDEIPYTKLYTTLFASPYRLDPEAFNLTPGASVPQYVLTTLPPAEEPEDNVGSPGFYSISMHNQGVNPRSSPPRLEYIYKIFSPSRVTSDLLSRILGHFVSEHESDHGDVNGSVSWIYHKIWYSYPREYPRVTFEEAKLDAGLWYTSGIESFISTMETSALSGKNVARLLRDGWVADGQVEGSNPVSQEEFPGENLVQEEL